jgi:hypothetical protein
VTETAALAHIWTALRDKLAQEHQLDDDELFDTLDGELDLADRLRSLVRKRREILANAEALKAMIKEMGERLARLENTANTITNAVVHAMCDAGIKKLPAPDFSVSVGYGKPPIIGAETAAIPERLLRIKTEVNRTALREALEAGETIPGCYLGNPSPHLIIRKT